MEKYYDGKSLYGDDFNKDEIAKWFEQEAEAYANLYGKYVDTNKHSLEAHNIDILYGYQCLKKVDKFDNVLGFGSSWGYEFLPIIDRIQKLTIIEPSTQTRSLQLGKIVPAYISPNIIGNLDFPDNCFDLITCFSALHHIPNVTFVLNELFRVLQPGGYLLLREPIHSMGDWRINRPGLTENERGIPKDYLLQIVNKANIEVVQKHYYHCMISFLRKKIKKINFEGRTYLSFDKCLSRLFTFNIHYHATNKIQRIAPSSVFLVLRKPVI